MPSLTCVNTLYNKHKHKHFPTTYLAMKPSKYPSYIPSHVTPKTSSEIGEVTSAWFARKPGQNNPKTINPEELRLFEYAATERRKWWGVECSRGQWCNRICWRTWQVDHLISLLCSLFCLSQVHSGSKPIWFLLDLCCNFVSSSLLLDLNFAVVSCVTSIFFIVNVSLLLRLYI